MIYSKEVIKKICELIESGESQRNAARAVGVCESQYYKWKQTKPEFADAVRNALEKFRAGILAKLEASLWKRAMGFEVTETEAEYVADANGNPKIKHQKTKTKTIAPDTGALIFALTNVAPDKWVNKQRVESIDEDKAQDTTDLQYYFENLPKDLVCKLADELQSEEFKRKIKDRDNK